jgi:hypothetical protein
MAADKQHAHELIEQLAPSQVPAAIGMLKSLLDPVARAIAERSHRRRARERGRAQGGRQVESLVQATWWTGNSARKKFSPSLAYLLIISRANSWRR